MIIAYVIELLQITLLLCLLLCIFCDGLNLSRNGLVGAQSLLANSLIDLLDVIEEFSGDSSLLWKRGQRKILDTDPVKYARSISIARVRTWSES